MNDHALTSLLLQGKPDKVILVGEPVFRLHAALADHVGDESGSAPAPVIATYDILNQFIDADAGVSPQCALCLHLPDDADEPEKMLGMACRTSPNLVLVEHSNTDPGAELLEDRQFFAFGFRRVGQSTTESGLQQHWYGYSLRDYKQPPDWLNARFWAHPERFDLQD